VLTGTGTAVVKVKAGMNEAHLAMRFVTVTGITGVPASGTAGVTLALNGTVNPANATNQAIVWTVKTDSGTGAGISNGNRLSTTGVGTVTVTATIANGTAVGTDYTQDFNITINPPPGTHMTPTLSGVSVPFRYVPAGSFRRDSTAANITITKGYWMGETEVTQELFQAVMGVNPSYFDNSIGREPDSGELQNQRPVEMVSWYDAIAFCNKLSLLDSKEPVYSVISVPDWNTVTIPTIDDPDWNNATMDTTKDGYRLPTEMEGMWAAIGADKTVQPNTTGYNKPFAGSTGSNSIGDCVWYDDNSNSKTHEVGKKAANELGLYDMSGNVVEWCWDRHGSYPGVDQTDPQGASLGTERVYRSSGYNHSAGSMRLGNRGHSTPQFLGSNQGFRVVCPQF
jgi:formylglycine-generating enzyme required for sulfatase activity